MKRLLQNIPAIVVVLVVALAVGAPLLGSPAVGQPMPEAAPTQRALILEDILVTGNKKLKDDAVLEAIRLSPGDALDVEILERERARLLTVHHILSDVNFFTRPGSERGAVILEIDVIERKTFALETGYGYHDVNGWFLTLLGLRFDKLANTDQQLRFGARLGFNLVSLDAEWEKPPPISGGLGANARLYFHGEERRFFGAGAPTDTGAGANSYKWNAPDWNEYRQTINRAGLELAALYRAGDTRFSFGVRSETVKPDGTFLDVELDATREFENFPNVLKEDIEETVITGLFFRMISDTRDHVIYPRSGSYTFLSLEANNSHLGGDEIFTKAKFDTRRLFDLGEDRVLAGRVSGGVSSSGTPYYERFTLGGIYSIRGFRELSLSPTAADDAFWLASCELRFPLIASTDGSPRLSGLVFFDVGKGWQRGDTFSADDLQSAAGYGFRLRLPWLGTLGLDAGIPFSAGRTDENFRVHGSLGFSF
jgi:outer membrane protein assembly factor BamA